MINCFSKIDKSLIKHASAEQQSPWTIFGGHINISVSGYGWQVRDFTAFFVGWFCFCFIWSFLRDNICCSVSPSSPLQSPRGSLKKQTGWRDEVPGRSCSPVGWQLIERSPFSSSHTRSQEQTRRTMNVKTRPIWRKTSLRPTGSTAWLNMLVFGCGRCSLFLISLFALLLTWAVWLLLH